MKLNLTFKYDVTKENRRAVYNMIRQQRLSVNYNNWLLKKKTWFVVPYSHDNGKIYNSLHLKNRKYD